jgi:hypothetical protein
MESKKGKINTIWILFIVLVFIGFHLSCGGNSSSTTKLSKEIQASIQNTMTSEAPFKDYSIETGTVKLDKSDDFNIKGTVEMTVNGKKNEVAINVISDGQNVVWYIEPTAFEFLENAPQKTIRAGLRTDSTINKINANKVAEPNERTDFKYELNKSKDGVVILEYVGTRHNVVVPITIEDFPVMEIASGAFKGNENITSVVLPQVRAILNNTFLDCKNLAVVTLPDTLLFIGDDVFENCQSLVSINIPENVIYIGRGAFFNCISLSSITLPNKIESIERSTFMNCSLLTSIKIPESVEYIFYQAFRNCSNLLEVELPQNKIIYIGGNSNINDDHYRVIFDKDSNTPIRQAQPLEYVWMRYGGKRDWSDKWEKISLSDLGSTTRINIWVAFNTWQDRVFQKFNIRPTPNNNAFADCFKLSLKMREIITQSGYEGTFN